MTKAQCYKALEQYRANTPDGALAEAKAISEMPVKEAIELLALMGLHAAHWIGKQGAPELPGIGDHEH